MPASNALRTAARVKSGRARDVDEIECLAVEHQVEVVVNASVANEIHCAMTALRDRIVNGDKRDIGSRAPSGKMGRGGDFAEARNRAAQHAQPGL